MENFSVLNDLLFSDENRYFGKKVVFSLHNFNKYSHEPSKWDITLPLFPIQKLRVGTSRGREPV